MFKKLFPRISEWLRLHRTPIKELEAEAIEIQDTMGAILRSGGHEILELKLVYLVLAARERKICDAISQRTWPGSPLLFGLTLRGTQISLCTQRLSYENALSS